MALTRRTDLALEDYRLWQQGAGRTTQLPGVAAREEVLLGLPVTRVDILDERGTQALGKGVGRYVTVELEGLSQRREGAFSRCARVIARELEGLMGEVPADGCVLVVGLGNRAITPDRIGPQVCAHTLVTRHLVAGAAEHFGHLRPVACLAPGVLGDTGMESGSVIRAVCASLRPALVMGVDALAARDVGRLCRTVQLSDGGIAPGSGVGNHRLPLTRESLGVPVIALGVPTVVDGATLAADLTGADEPPALGRELVVTPRDIDQQVADLAKVMAYGLNLALQPQLSLEELELLLN